MKLSVENSQLFPEYKINLGSVSLPGFTKIPTLHPRADLYQKTAVESLLRGYGYKFLHEIFRRWWSLPFFCSVPVVTRTLRIILTSNYPALWLFIHASFPLLGFRNMEGRDCILHYVWALASHLTSLCFSSCHLSNRDKRTYRVGLL